MPYDPKDPRSSLASDAAAKSKMPTEFAGVEYVKFYEIEPDETSPGVRTWYARGQNMIIAYTEASADTIFPRKGQPDQYVLLLPYRTVSVDITTGDGVKRVDGYTISFLPPGDSSVRVVAGGRFFRLFTIRSEDLAKKCSNAASYETAHPNVAPYKPWPAPVDGYRLRTYSFDVAAQEGRFGRIWRGSTFMVNYIDGGGKGPRDITKMSPHSHDDFEQCSILFEGVMVRHVRWPWITNMKKWRADDHEVCGAPSMVVVPPLALHTQQSMAERQRSVDIYCPPRVDFSQQQGWVLNADEYPLP
jgi:hypothetical protein